MIHKKNNHEMLDESMVGESRVWGKKKQKHQQIQDISCV